MRSCSEEKCGLIHPEPSNVNRLHSIARSPGTGYQIAELWWRDQRSFSTWSTIASHTVAYPYGARIAPHSSPSRIHLTSTQRTRSILLAVIPHN